MRSGLHHTRQPEVVHAVVRRDGDVQGEIFAAEGFGKVTGEVGVCIATSGPGATNLVTGLADALLDSVPMVAITGQARHCRAASLCCKQNMQTCARARCTELEAVLKLGWPAVASTRKSGSADGHVPRENFKSVWCHTPGLRCKGVHS